MPKGKKGSRKKESKPRSKRRDDHICPRCNCNPRPYTETRDLTFYHSYCSECNTEKSKEWRLSNRERYNAYHREYRARRKADSA